jgi:hypothetical protein
MGAKGVGGVSRRRQRMGEHDNIESRMRTLAEDLAAVSGYSVEDAAAAVRAALNITTPLFPTFRKAPWYLRVLPIRWQQKWILKAIDK